MQNAVAPADMKTSKITCIKKMKMQFNPEVNENIHRYSYYELTNNGFPFNLLTSIIEDLYLPD